MSGPLPEVVCPLPEVVCRCTRLAAGFELVTTQPRVPYFKAYMTLAAGFRHPTLHPEHHRPQPTHGAPECESCLVI